jgi:hypothetical protein
MHAHRPVLLSRVICEAVPTTGCRPAFCLAIFPFATSGLSPHGKKQSVAPETMEEGRCTKETKNKSSTEIMANNYSVLCAKHVSKFEGTSGRIVYI